MNQLDNTTMHFHSKRYPYRYLYKMSNIPVTTMWSLNGWSSLLQLFLVTKFALRKTRRAFISSCTDLGTVGFHSSFLQQVRTRSRCGGLIRILLKFFRAQISPTVPKHETIRRSSAGERSDNNRYTRTRHWGACENRSIMGIAMPQ